MQFYETPRITADREIWSNRIALRYGIETHNGLKVAQPAVLVAHEEGVTVPPFLELHPGIAQQLMDALWQCGLRPTEGTGSAGSLAATERHLEDMRRLVFDTKEKP